MNWIKRYSAAVVLSALALWFNVLHYVLEVRVDPMSGTRAYWLLTTAENMQSEMWQVAAAAFVFSHWRWAGSPEDNPEARHAGWALLAPMAVVGLTWFLFHWAT